MKNINELAKELADFYGIEYVDAPIGHILVGADGAERSVNPKDLIEIFGFDQRPVDGLCEIFADLPRVFSFSGSFKNPAPIAIPVHYFAVSNKSRQATTGNYAYATAA